MSDGVYPSYYVKDWNYIMRRLNTLWLHHVARLVAGLLLVLFACKAPETDDVTTNAHEGSESVGWLESLDPRFDSLVSPDARIEVLAEGFTWSEGPVWIDEGSYLLFSDVPENTAYKWSESDGLQEFLKPSGDTGFATGGQEGSNGLTLDSEGRLVLFQHGDRRVARLATSLAEARPEFETIASHFEGRRFNSPNDGTYRSDGSLYFTDPPYGLEDSSKTELGFYGVYRVATDGSVTLLTDALSRPNGIAFSQDEQTVYVANSDPGRAIWMQYNVRPDGSIDEGRLFFDATKWTGERPGLPDGLKVDKQGNVFATGPGGVLVFDPSGAHLGTIRLSVPSANCAFGGDGSTLYITAQKYLLRVPLLTSG
ncbi:MAG: SMP-30/gluconolactonase/LRE family protein [Rhodothermales bacterium]|nr:SMP-30/gluconolactonase/LRE family protein [Rhodothermales bacterium]